MAPCRRAGSLLYATKGVHSSTRVHDTLEVAGAPSEDQRLGLKSQG